MSLAYKRLKVYLRVGLVLTVVVLGALVLFKNRDHRVRLWFFGLTDPDKPTNVVWVMLWSVAIARTVWWMVSLSRGMVRDLREIRNRRADEKAKQVQQQRIAALEQREQEINEKLKQVNEVEGGDGA